MDGLNLGQIWKSLYFCSNEVLSSRILPISLSTLCAIAATGVASYPLLPSSPCSDSDEDFSDLENHETSRMRYQPLRSNNPPRPHAGGPPPQRGIRGGRGIGPRGGPRSHRGTARSYSSESSRHVGAGLHQPLTGHTVSSPFPSPHLSNDSDVFSLQRKFIVRWTQERYLLLSLPIRLSVFQCFINLTFVKKYS